MNMKQLKKLSKVSEYIEQGGMASGAYLLENPAKETKKAIAFPGVKFNSYGNPYDALIWFPKSQLVEVENDYYTNNAPAKMHLCPEWLYRKNPTVGETAA
jgi:hypothetical protein